MRRGRNRTAMAEIVIWQEIWAETAISVLEIAIWVETGATPGSGVRAACELESATAPAAGWERHAS